MVDTTWAEKIVVVNPDGTPITAGASANVAKATAAAPAYAEGANVQLSVDLAGNLRTSGGGGGGAVDVSDRAARLVGVVYGSQAQQLKQTATNFNLATEVHVGATAVDPRSIRALTAADVVTANQGGAPWSVTFPSAQSVDVTDRAARALGVVASVTAVVHVDDNAASLTVDAPVATPVAVRLSDGAAFIDPRDVSDRAARLLGVVDKGKIWDGTNIATVKAAAIAVNADNPLVVTMHPLSAPMTTQPVSIAAAIDVSDRAARLVGRVYGSQGQQLLQTPTNFNQQVEVAVGATLIDPRSIRALTAADVVSIGDGTDTVTVLPVRTQPATTEKLLMVADLPIRLATYQVTTITVAPAITIGVKELLALWYTGGTKDIYIVEIWASGLVTTASTTGGRTTVRVSTITTAPTGGTEEAKVDIAGAGASAITNTMRVKTGGGAIGSTFIRREVWHATQAIGSTYDKSIFTASSVGNGIILRGGASSGISIDVEREVAHTALVDSWTVGVRWLEL